MPFDLPFTVSDSLSKVGSTTTPLALISLGVYIANHTGISDFKLPLLSTVFKLFIYPAIFYVVFYVVLGMSDEVAQTSVILAAMPTAVFSLIVADMFGLDVKQTTNSIILSTFVFLLSLGFWVAVV